MLGELGRRPSFYTRNAGLSRVAFIPDGPLDSTYDLNSTITIPISSQLCCALTGDGGVSNRSNGMFIYAHYGCGAKGIRFLDGFEVVIKAMK